VVKIDWLVSNPDPSIGSYRIWIKDANKVMQEFGIDSIIPGMPNGRFNFRDDSAIILSKGDAHLSKTITTDMRKKHGIIVGAINVALPMSADDVLPLDFVVVGSTEEKISLQEFYNNVFIVNLIENIYSDKLLKKHEDKDCINVGYHGWHPHLKTLNYWGAPKVFEEINKHKKVKITTVTDDPKKANKVFLEMSIPESIEVDHKKWEYSSVTKDIESFDVCLVPNAKDISQEINLIEDPSSGLYKTDYVFRFKNKSNPGRAFVAYQLGIPVITDLTPSNMPMLHDEQCGFIVNGTNSFYRSLMILLSAQNRDTISRKAQKRFNRVYSFKKDLLQLVEEIKIIKERT
jgi:hypothetical protein